MRRLKRKAAIELSIGTIVIVVLAMTMLILGLVLIRSIFSGATYNVQTMNQKVRDEINKLFVEDKKIVIYLANQEAKMTQGEGWGVAFGIKNLKTDASGDNKFHYLIEASDPKLKEKCKINEATANSWVKTGVEDTVTIPSGDSYVGIARFNIPVGSPLCTIRYHLEVKNEGTVYATDFFDVTVQAK